MYFQIYFMCECWMSTGDRCGQFFEVKWSLKLKDYHSPIICYLYGIGKNGNYSQQKLCEMKSCLASLASWIMVSWKQLLENVECCKIVSESCGIWSIIRLSFTIRMSPCQNLLIFSKLRLKTEEPSQLVYTGLVMVVMVVWGLTSFLWW